MSELVEKVARALANREGFRDPSPYRKPAQAVIAAVLDWMAEPSEGAIAAGNDDELGYADEVFRSMLAHLRREALG